MLPNVIVIGAMKCGTSAVHAYLDAHPDVAMAPAKELNFFNGPERPEPGDPRPAWVRGRWSHGLEWYAAQFDDTAPVRGEASPAYTSPTFPEVAGRMASVLPDVRLVYLVRDPVGRALSQYAHHRREGSERRPVERALLDPDSQYVARSRYAERVAPYLDHFERDQVHVVVAERLLTRRTEELARLYRHVGVDPGWRGEAQGRRFHVGGGDTDLDPRVRERLRELTADDTDRMRDLIDDDLEEWQR